MAGNDYNYEERQRLMAQRRKQRLEMKRRHQRNQRIFFGGILLVLILLIVLIVRGCGGGQESLQDLTNDTQADTQAETADAVQEQDTAQVPYEEPVANTATVRISCVGDIMIYDDQITAAAQPDGSYDFSLSFSKIRDYLSDADITTANLETTFADGYDYTGHVPYFNAPTDLAQNLANAGFDILSTANTYSMLYGVSGLFSTIRHIRDAGMNNVGTYYTQADRDRDGGAAIVDVSGIKVAFLAYTKNINDMYLTEGYEYTVNLLYDDYYDSYTGIKEQMLIDDVQAARAAGADIVIVLPHWGSEYVFSTRDEQEQIADLLFENGVDAIIGSHSHVVNAMETRSITTVDGEEKTGFIAYGLGNFLSSMNKDYTRQTVILNLTFEKDLDTGKVSLADVGYIPCYMLETGPDGYSKFQIVSIHDEIAAYLSNANGCVDEETYTILTRALEDIHEHAGEGFDIGLSASTATESETVIESTAAEPDVTSALPQNVISPED